jgi:opacity protein-like surface antigen
MYRSFLAIAIAGAFVTTTAMAQDMQLKPYVEGQISRMMIDDVDATTSIQAGGFNAVINATAEYDYDTAFGVEAGLASIGGTGFRVGLGYTRFDAKLEAVSFAANGTLAINGVVLTGAASGRVTGDTLRNAGADIGEKVRAYSINSYYDFELGNSFKPYLGVGIGMADIENMKDKEVMLSGYAGVNYAFTENVYAGLRASIHHVQGPEDELGIKYDDLRTYAVGAVVGYKF